MSAMGELNFFLGLQVLQKEDGIFLSQDKYIGDIVKKFGFSDVKSSNTPMDKENPWGKDGTGKDKYVGDILKKFGCSDVRSSNTPINKENPWGKDGTGKDVDLHLYRSMIGTLMYLTASRPDIMFVVYACARHQVTPKECHMRRESSRLVLAFTSFFLLCMSSAVTVAVLPFLLLVPSLVVAIFTAVASIFFWQWQLSSLAVRTSSASGDSIIGSGNALCILFPTSSTMASAIICLANNQKFNFSKYILTSLVKNLEAGVPFYMFPRFIQVFRNHQLSDMSHNKGSSTNLALPLSLACDFEDTETNTEEHVPTPSNDPLPSGEDRMQLKELMELFTNMSNKVLDLENEVIEIKSSHKSKIKELESRMEKLEEENSTAVDKLNAANEKPESTTRTNSSKSQAKDKGKAKLVEEPKILKSRKDQIALDEVVTRRIETEWNADMKDNIGLNEVVEHVQSRQSDAVRKYQALKKTYVSSSS
nr:hypothetical protein [Tanacetum cinerariifolium]